MARPVTQLMSYAKSQCHKARFYNLANAVTLLFTMIGMSAIATRHQHENAVINAAIDPSRSIFQPIPPSAPLEPAQKVQTSYMLSSAVDGHHRAGRLTHAEVEIQVKDDYEMLNLDNMDAVQDVSCSANGTILQWLRFRDPSYVDAARRWPAGLLLMLSHRWRCGHPSSSGDQGPITRIFLLDHMNRNDTDGYASHSGSNAIDLTAHMVPNIGSYIDKFKMSIGQPIGMVSRSRKLNRRWEIGSRRALKMPVNLWYDAEANFTNRPNFVIYTPPGGIVTSTLRCANCYVFGNLNVGLYIEGTSFEEYTMHIALGANITTNAEIAGIIPKPYVGFQNRNLGKPIELRRFILPGLLAFGATLQVKSHMRLEMDSDVNISGGFRTDTKDLTFELRNGKVIKHGYTQFDGLPLKVNQGSIPVVSGDVHLVPQIAMTLRVFEKDYHFGIALDAYADGRIRPESTECDGKPQLVSVGGMGWGVKWLDQFTPVGRLPERELGAVCLPGIPNLTAFRRQQGIAWPPQDSFIPEDFPSFGRVVMNADVMDADVQGLDLEAIPFES